MTHSKLPLGTPVSPRILSALRSRVSKRLRGFTLVELIVVITILAILATIGFLALSGYTSDANKSAVVGNLRTVEKGLSTNATVTGKFPSPSGAVTVTYSGGVAWYQGTAGKSVMSVIGMGEPPKDPQGNSEFDYSLSANGMEYQVASAYLSSAEAGTFATEASAAETDGKNVRTPTAAVTGNYNGLFVPVSTGGTNYLVAAPSIILSNVSLSARELKTMQPSFVVDGKPGTPASWSGKVAGLSQTGIAFGWTNYSSGKIFESATEAFPKTSTGVSDVASAISSAYSGTSLASVSRIQAFLASPSNMDSAVSAAGQNALGRDMAPAYSTSSSSGGGSSGTPGNSCAAQPSFSNAGTFTSGSPSSVGQAWTYSATPGNCTYTCASGWKWSNCVTPHVDSYWSNVVLLMRMEGASGSTNFTDEKQHVLTANGGYIISQNGMFGGSAAFGSGILAQNISSPNSADWDFGSGDFTIEFWIHPTQTQHADIVSTHQPWVSNGWRARLDGNYPSMRVTSSDTLVATSSIAITNNAWNHVAYSKSSGTFRIFVNGQKGAEVSSAHSYGTAGNSLIVGGFLNWPGALSLIGKLDEVRITKGVSRYVADFSANVPTEPFPNQAPPRATFNPSDIHTNVTLSNGNLTVYKTNSYGGARANIGKSSGKWYWEVKVDSGGGSYPIVGVSDGNLAIGTDVMLGATSYKYSGTSATKVTNTWMGTAYGATFANNDIVGVALDMDGGTLTFYKNGVSQGQAYSGITGTMYPIITSGSGPVQLTANFGQSTFAYPVPSGYNSGLY